MFGRVLRPLGGVDIDKVDKHGHLGRKRESAKGMALAGLITGYASVALSVVMWILLFLLALSPLFILPFLPLTNGD